MGKITKVLGFLVFVPVVVISLTKITKNRKIDEIVKSSEKFIPTGDGLLIVYLVLPDYPDAPTPPECIEKKGIRRILCISEKYCEGKSKSQLGHCVAQKLKQLRSPANRQNKDEQMRVLVRPESIELQNATNQKWISLEGKWLGKFPFT